MANFGPKIKIFAVLVFFRGELPAKQKKMKKNGLLGAKLPYSLNHTVYIKVFELVISIIMYQGISVH